MRLLLDVGNTRLKWQLLEAGEVLEAGGAPLGNYDDLSVLVSASPRIHHIGVSTVISERQREELVSHLAGLSAVPVHFYWAEPARNGLVNAYARVETMGADRWHAMYAAWRIGGGGFMVVDAGSAVTLDLVDHSGRHLGGYILPGRQMMLRSLRSDAARIGFDASAGEHSAPGASTTECVNHGLAWLWQSLVARVHGDCSRLGLDHILVTGGDAPHLLSAGLGAEHHPHLVLQGLAAIDEETVDL